MFLVRLAFWITVVALLLPAPDTPTQARSGGAVPASLSTPLPAERLELSEVAGAAMASAEDVLSFCERNPATCDTGLAVASHVQRQVTYYGGLALSWIAEKGLDTNQTSTQVPMRDALEVSTPSTAVSRGA